MKKYPFDASLKHHLLVGLALAIWIFIFLYFTEPLDVNEFGDREKIIYLPFYGLIGALCYIIMLPLQNFLYKRSQKQWSLKNEIIFNLAFIAFSFVLARTYYVYVIVYGESNPYTLWYYTTSIFIPAIVTILPIVLAGRWALGKYKNKRLEESKIEIKGEGNYESLRLLLNDLICIQSSDNYVEVSFLDNNILKKQLIRNKLSVVETNFPELIRTHRSFLMNPYHFQSWKTENGKLGIVASNAIFIPISKTYATAVKTTINSTTN
ncbi:LytTR family DNA-binding domain-containing protein [uncultured Dokdonia sp.]|uniref:LytTR family DNA-binding domain-containing protein n=1 Tax=uncultured Dokdonia sp. TaxID=575653 RepID=UPI00260BAB9D|nr:LytTR family DNA-binding domain-containing protein [uncultured Dokdonia sp.]